MREIKFRAYDGRRMYFFNLFSLCNGVLHSDVDKDCELDGCAIMQYTGLKDKNGVEIYEGDMLEHSWTDNGFSFNEPVTHVRRGVIVYQLKDTLNSASFVLKCRWRDTDDFNSFHLGNIHRWEVIGNIYENPELVK